MDAEINDLPSTLQQYLSCTTTHKRFEPGHDLFTSPLVHSAPLNTIVTYHRNHINIRSRAANIHLIQKPYIMGKAHPSSHALSYIPNTMFFY